MCGNVHPPRDINLQEADAAHSVFELGELPAHARTLAAVLRGKLNQRRMLSKLLCRDTVFFGRQPIQINLFWPDQLPTSTAQQAVGNAGYGAQGKQQQHKSQRVHPDRLGQVQIPLRSVTTFYFPLCSRLCRMSDIEFRSDVTVELVRHSAQDADVLFAARVSTQGEQTLESAKQSDGDVEKRDRGLINYLMRDRHGSPFEHNSLTFYVQAPIFVFREFMRHRIASYNEESGRYRELRPVFYVPNEERKLIQVGKPGAYDFVDGSAEQFALVQQETMSVTRAAYEAYQRMLEAGVAREVARIVLPLNIYSSMYVTMNARSLMNFLSLRTKREGTHFPSFPQREIEMVAEKMEDLWAELMPMSYAAFNENGRVAP